MSLLRREVALNLSSSSCANCCSKPSSRLSKVVMPLVLVLRGTAPIACRLAYRGCPVKATLIDGNIVVAEDAASVYADCTPRRVRLALKSRRGQCLSRTPIAAAADLDT